MKFKRVPIRTGPSGNSLSIPVYFFEGSVKGSKSAYFQASIHGAELQGNAVIFQLIEYFKKNPPLGAVTLVPCANPQGMDRKTGDYTDGRFDPVTGENWNRAYFMPVCQSKAQQKDLAQLCLETLPAQSSILSLKRKLALAIGNKKKRALRFAEKLALILQELASSADLILDLHNANCSKTYLYAFEEHLQDALYLGIPAIISIPPDFGGALDEAFTAPWSILSKKYGFRREEIPQSYTLELGSQESISSELALVQTAGILEFLKHHGVIKGKAKNPASAVVGKLQDYLAVHAKRGGLYEFKFELRKPVKKGSILATCLSFDASGGVLTKVAAECDLFPLMHFSSSAAGEGDELLKGFSAWSTVSKE